MQSQKEIWHAEHIGQNIFTRMHSEKPSGPVPVFADFLKQQGFIPAKTSILDIGCGKGRNSIYLASRGFCVTGIDFVFAAIEEAIRKGKGTVQFNIADLIENWNFSNRSFEAIIDCNTTICIPEPGRSMAIKEAYRVLKPGGYYLFYGIAPTEALNQFQGPEPNCAIFAKTGKFEKQYSEEELKRAYKKFELVNLKKVKGSDIIEGKLIEYFIWVASFMKS